MTRRSSVEIASYCPDWPRTFEAERIALAEIFPQSAFRIEHVGSTAVRELPAKPIVDILIGAGSLAEIEARIREMEAHGYRYVPEYEAVLPQRRYFTKPKDPPRRFHVHAVEIDSRFWAEHLLFRDALRADRALAAEYGALKIALATRFGDDREAYTDAKTPFIQAVLRRARQ
ncbi:MAG: GrpB family protein [Casimicrobiaceae bacterium]